MVVGKNAAATTLVAAFLLVLGVKREDTKILVPAHPTSWSKTDEQLKGICAPLSHINLVGEEGAHLHNLKESST